MKWYIFPSFAECRSKDKRGKEYGSNSCILHKTSSRSHWNVSHSFSFIERTSILNKFTNHHEYMLNQNTGDSHFCFTCARICFPVFSLSAPSPPYLNFNISKCESEKKVKQQFLWNKERNFSSERFRDHRFTETG